MRLEELVAKNDQSPERRELDEYINVHAPNPSYAVNKGWLDSVEHLADCILDGRPCELSTAEDGMKAMLLGYAAIQSRECGQVIKGPFVPHDHEGSGVEKAIAATINTKVLRPAPARRS
jgi:hypothetical protein